jgi:hypothetical protein
MLDLLSGKRGFDQCLWAVSRNAGGSLAGRVRATFQGGARVGSGLKVRKGGATVYETRIDHTSIISPANR